MAMGAAVVGLGGAGYALYQTEEGRAWGDQAFMWVQETLGMAPPEPTVTTKSLQEGKKVQIKGTEKTKPSGAGDAGGTSILSGLPNE